MSAEKIGDICEVKRGRRVEWKVLTTTLSLLFDEKDVCYISPKFYFAGSSWSLLAYPFFDEGESQDTIRILLIRTSYGSPINLSYRYHLINPNAKQNLDNDPHEMVFDCNWKGEPSHLMISRSDVKIEWKEITITCSINSTNRIDISESLLHRLQLLSHNVEDIYKEGKRTDLVVKVEGESLLAHRMILETRAPVFGAILDNSYTNENQTREISIEGLKKSAVDATLAYLYSGEIEKLTTNNVLAFYATAKKYDIKVLKNMYLKFISRNLSEDWFYDVIRFADELNDDEVRHTAKEYYKKNVCNILDSDKWKAFINENPNVVLRFLS